MMLEHYIHELLYRYECVIVPNLGAFITNTIPATISTNNYTFYPPSKIISFNEQLSANDGLLIKHIAETEKKTYKEVLETVKEQVAVWQLALSNNEKINLTYIGNLWRNKEEKLLFEPAKDINYLTTSFGLSTFVSQSIIREQLKEEVVLLEEKTPLLFTPEKRNDNSSKYVYLKYAAMFLLAVSTGLTGYKFVQTKQIHNQQILVENAQKQIEKTIQEATFFDSIPLELPSVILSVNKQPQKYHIIAGAFRIKANANRKIVQLQNKGYKAEYLGVNNSNLHTISYDSFSDVNEALSFLRTIKTTENSEAWLWVKE